jgi:CBS domain containing-hemolysin-like protein
VLARLSVIVVLLLLNGYFVAVEFALVRARRTRLLAMVRAGDPVARFAVAASGNLARVLSASQIGITAASLALGWVAEDTFGVMLAGALESLPVAVEASVRVTIGGGIALMSVTYLHVVFGELAPRSAALSHPERFAKWLAPPLLAWAWVMTPFINVLNRSAAFVLSLFGQRLGEAHDSVHSPEELRILVEQSEEKGAIETTDAALIDAVLEFSEKNAREVMTPRTNIVAISASATLDEALATVREARFSRYPVYEESVDNIAGMVHARDLLWALSDRRDGFRVRDAVRPVHVVPGTREVEEVLADFKRTREHLAIVIDEFGGTAGLVTMEDLLEEIVGDIRDEFDDSAEAAAPRAAPGEVLVPGSSAVSDVNAQYGLTVGDGDYTTIGGVVFGALGRLPVAGDRVEAGGATWTVRAMEGRRIATLALEQKTVAGNE